MGTRANGGERLTEVDLLIEVLSRLCVKPLLRCKSVSKSWYHLISSPSFAKSHLQRAITSCVVDDEDEKNLIVCRIDTCLKHRMEDGIFSLLNLGTGQTGKDLKFPYPQGEYPVDPPSLLVGFVCGIACVSVDNSNDTKYWRLTANLPSNIYLWNPTIKQSKLIPPHTIHNDDKTKVALGFGFDPIEFYFKVVRVVSSVISPEVYSAKRDAWRNIDSNLTDVPRRCSFEVCLHGLLITTGNNGMMAFDLNKEVFVCGIKLPVNLSGNRSHVFSNALIADYKDSIAVIISKIVDRPNVINLWTLDDEACLRGGGVEASWTFKLSIGLDFQYYIFHGFYNSADLLLFSSGWYLYNIDKNVGRRITFRPYFCYQGTIFKYSESLISFAGSKLVNWHADEDDNHTSKVDLEDDNDTSKVDLEDDTD